jgi:dipeptidyl aminopeptidase/acylaminoacyl peptidase
VTLAGAEAPVIEGISVNGPSVGEYAFSDSGLLVYMEGFAGGSERKTTLYWTDGRGQLEALSDDQFWGTGRLSRDGRRVVNSMSSTAGTRGTSSEIWILDVEQRTRTRLTFDGQNANPIWSPDGRTITYGGAPSGKTGLYRVAADGSSRPELLFATSSFPTPFSWSPDGKTLLYSQADSGKPSRIWVLPVPEARPASRRRCTTPRSMVQTLSSLPTAAGSHTFPSNPVRRRFMYSRFPALARRRASRPTEVLHLAGHAAGARFSTEVPPATD